VTDVAIKRKIRNTLPLAAEDPERYSIFVEAGHALNTKAAETMSANKIDTKKKRLSADELQTARGWLCQRYADIRLFGAVLSTGDTKALGQVYGPLQVTNARSIDPVFPQHHTITRITQTTQADIDKGENTEFGGKWTVPYGLYKAELYYSASRGQETGVDSRDFELLYRSLEMMFDHDRSATRGTMTPRALYVFNHDNAFGNAPAHKLVDRVKVDRESEDEPPRGFSDYAVSVDDDGLPSGVTLTKLIA
jgi:CRISPR-associated protein Csd2